MKQETERTDAADNIVLFIDALRRRRSSVEVRQLIAAPTDAPGDGASPPGAA